MADWCVSILSCYWYMYCLFAITDAFYVWWVIVKLAVCASVNVNKYQSHKSKGKYMTFKSKYFMSVLKHRPRPSTSRAPTSLVCGVRRFATCGGGRSWTSSPSCKQALYRHSAWNSAGDQSCGNWVLSLKQLNTPIPDLFIYANSRYR